MIEGAVAVVGKVHADLEMTVIKDDLESASDQQMGQGLIDGISDMISNVKETISGVAETVSSKFKELLGIASPSKVFSQYGKFIDEGLSRGMQKNTWMVSDATEEVGDAAIDGMSKVISDISEVVENGIDYQPTIRPVLDLTNVTEGIDTMNGMLSDSSAVDLASSNSDMINGKISRLDAFSMSLDLIREALGHNKKGDRGFGTQNNTFNIMLHIYIFYIISKLHNPYLFQ